MQKTLEINVSVFIMILLSLMLLCVVPGPVFANETVSVTVNYSNVTSELQTITVDFCDDWLLQPDDQYNHKLMQASFAMAVAGFRSKVYEIGDKDHDIREFFTKAGFTGLQSDDFNRPTGIDTIGTMIAHKKLGEDTLIAISVSGNNYENEWLSNLTIENEIRPKGFTSAASTVMQRVDKYITKFQLEGRLHLWIAGYSRAAAVSNIFAADAVNTHKFAGVFAYTFATPRTTREPNPDRYHNIFNFINPEDVVPMIPFPEWGYQRYGKDLFLPSISTDSGYNRKYVAAGELPGNDPDDLPLFNPRMRRNLHTNLDYLAYFVNSADSYTRGFQSSLLKFYQDKDLKALLKVLVEKIDFGQILGSLKRQDAIIYQRLYEFYNFFDFNARLVFLSYLSDKFGSEDDYWDNALSLQENLAFGHYDKSYRFWLFSSDDPDEIFTENPIYLHYTILGDVNVEVLDQNGDMIQQFDSDGWFIFDTDEPYNPDFHGEESYMILYMERTGNQTMIELPGDQIFTIYIKSNKDQQIKVSVVEYSAETLKSNVLYIYYDDYKKDEGFPEVINPPMEKLVTDEQLAEEGVAGVAHAWGTDIDYSPSAVMRLENAGFFLPKSLAVIILMQVIVNQIVGVLIILIIHFSTRGVFFVRKKVFKKEIIVRIDRLELPDRKKTQSRDLKPVTETSQQSG